MDLKDDVKATDVFGEDKREEYFDVGLVGSERNISCSMFGLE